ncbi:MAG: thiolase family protein [Candidatus Delongbacteria bacterium]|nr:thiolase family protein [Candidatus Delongbacteria bacterium]
MKTRSSAVAVIVDAARSPIALKNSPLLALRPDDLGATVLRALLERNPALDLNDLEDIQYGCAFPEGLQGMLIARAIAVLAGVPHTAGAVVCNRFCGSSMETTHNISRAIELGELQVGVAGGIEDMLRVPMGGYNPSFNPLLYDKGYYIGMGETAEILAQELDISRADQEQFAVASHQKALAAQKEDRFAREIIPITAGEETVAIDEGPREPNLEKIRSLDPAFDAAGTITAATSSPVSYGTAALLLTSEKYAEAHGLTIRAEIVSRAVAGVEWDKMGKGPLPATEKALVRANLKLADIDAIELNEAFAAQALYVIRQGRWDLEKVNLNGGALALGHPLGTSGARILTTLLNVLEQKDVDLGLATMCIGTGQGIATIIRRR